MKKYLCLICALLFMTSYITASADSALSSMTDDDLITLINTAMHELNSRASDADEPTVIYNADGIYIAFTESAMSSTGKTIAQNFILKNLSPYGLKLTLKKAEVNGWTVQDAYFYLNNFGNYAQTIAADSSYRDLHFALSNIDDDAGVTQADDVKTVVFTIGLDYYLSDGTRKKCTVIVSCIAAEDRTMKIVSITQAD